MLEILEILFYSVIIIAIFSFLSFHAGRHYPILPSDWIKRLELEIEELDDKMKKLKRFIASENFKDLDVEYKNLLIRQYKTMDIYLEILKARYRIIFTNEN